MNMKYQHEIYFFAVEEPIYILSEDNNLASLYEMIKEFGHDPSQVTTVNTIKLVDDLEELLKLYNEDYLT